MRFAVARKATSDGLGSEFFVVVNTGEFSYKATGLADATCLTKWFNELDSKKILGSASDEQLKEFAERILEVRPKSNRQLIEYSIRILAAIAAPKLK